VAFFVDFGHVTLPKNLNVPPSLRMLGVEPQTKLNCEILDADSGFEVRWAVAGSSVVTQLVAKYVIQYFLCENIFLFKNYTKHSVINQKNIT